MSVTIKEIAERTNLSVATISRVVNNSDKVKTETREKVLSALKEAGYSQNYLARSLVMGKMQTLELIIPGGEEFLNAYYFQELFLGINKGIHKANHNILVSQQRKKEEGLLRRKFPVDGYIIISLTIDSPILKEMECSHTPAVLINQKSKVLNWVDVDNVSSAKKIINHLVNLGHRHISIISGGENVRNSVDRVIGYKKTLEENGINFNPDYVFNGEFSEEKAFEKTIELISKNLPVTAIFACNDLMAIGAIRAIESKNLKVPEDIAVAGFDDIDLASYFSPAITTIRQPLYEMGLTAVNLLIEQIEEGKGEQVSKEFSGELVIRKSCGG